MRPALARHGVPSERFLELLLQVARRPAAQCTYRPGQLETPARLFSSRARLDYCRTSCRKAKNPSDDLLLAPKPAAPKVPLHIGLDRNPDAVSAISRIPIPKGERGENFTPSVLARPLGLPYPPLPGQNTPKDSRTLSEKRKDFEDYDQVVQRRRKLLRSYLRPYFQEWRRVNHHKGKSFVANERLFKAEKALYFPNMWGQTLSKAGDGLDNGRDTTSALRGKVTVVGVQSGQWAEEQVATFLHQKHNPALQELIDGSAGVVQRADINVQDQWHKALLVKLFKGNLRKMVPEAQWERYFMVRLARDIGRGLTEEIRDAMGFLNSQVGYVYLLDRDCRIRWAGSGHAWKGEVESLNNGIRRLASEVKAGSNPKPLAQDLMRKQSDVESHESGPQRLVATS